jgi:hypothetical protein
MKEERRLFQQRREPFPEEPLEDGFVTRVGCDGKNVGVEICFSFRPHPVRISNLLFPLPFLSLSERMDCLYWRVAPELTSVETM